MTQIRLFSALPEHAQTKLRASSVRRKYRSGRALVREGDEINSVIILRKGRVKTSRIDAQGEEYILHILHDGQAIWHDMFLKDYQYHYNVIALTDVETCEISRDEFMRVLSEEKDAAMSLIVMLSTELKDAEDKTVLLSIRNPELRLAGLFLDRDEKCTNHLISMKLDDIAACIGLRRETVSRNITKLEARKMIRRVGRGEIQVIDRKALQKFFDLGVPEDSFSESGRKKTDADR